MRPHSHKPEDIVRRLEAGPKFSYLRDWVYGGVDGAVTTFAVVSTVVGAELSTRTILILGFANLVADGFSMAAGNFLSTKTEADELRQVEAYERKQVQRSPEGEREEVRQILKLKGFEGELLEKTVALFTSDRDQWVQFMLAEEYGLPSSVRSPWKSAISTFSAFALCGLIPLLPYLFTKEGFAAATVLTGFTFFAIGSLKSRWTIQLWWKSGLKTFAVGMTAAAFAYAIGAFLKDLVN